VNPLVPYLDSVVKYLRDVPVLVFFIWEFHKDIYIMVPSQERILGIASAKFKMCILYLYLLKDRIDQIIDALSLLLPGLYVIKDAHIIMALFIYIKIINAGIT